MEIALFSTEGAQFLLRWIHFIAGVTWIGVLYYFNFIQGEWFKEVDAGTKSTAVKTLVPRALWWFRWGAMFTFLSGFLILIMKANQGGAALFSTSYGIFILTGALLGTLMFLNVWLVIWPAQKIVIAGGKGAAQAAPKAALASRTNTLFSFPMLFFMGGASHLPVSVAEDFQSGALTIVLGVIILGLELNALKGKMGPMASVKGVIHMGVLLTLVLYGVIEALT